MLSATTFDDGDGGEGQQQQRQQLSLQPTTTVAALKRMVYDDVDFGEVISRLVLLYSIMLLSNRISVCIYELI